MPQGYLGVVSYEILKTSYDDDGAFTARVHVNNWPEPVLVEVTSPGPWVEINTKRLHPTGTRLLLTVQQSTFVAALTYFVDETAMRFGFRYNVTNSNRQGCPAVGNVSNAIDGGECPVIYVGDELRESYKLRPYQDITFDGDFKDTAAQVLGYPTYFEYAVRTLGSALSMPIPNYPGMGISPDPCPSTCSGKNVSMFLAPLQVFADDFAQDGCKTCFSKDTSPVDQAWWNTSAAEPLLSETVELDLRNATTAARARELAGVDEDSADEAGATQQYALMRKNGKLVPAVHAPLGEYFAFNTVRYDMNEADCTLVKTNNSESRRDIRFENMASLPPLPLTGDATSALKVRYKLRMFTA